MLRLVCATAMFCAVVGCSSEPPTTQTKREAKGAIPFVLDKVSDRFDGVVSEVVFVDGYVYAAVDVAGDVRWVVSLKKPIATGDHVAVHAFGKKDAFHSKKLDREFASLWFSVVTVTEQQQQREGDKS